MPAKPNSKPPSVADTKKPLGISAKGPGIAVRVDYPGSRIVKGVA
jgi:hypothetical protein